MKGHFSGLSPYKRYTQLRRLLKSFKVKAREVKAPFSIICYGSASYGFNPGLYGKLDDLDLFMIVDPSITADKIVSFSRKIFSNDLEINLHHLEYLLSGNCEICRMYAKSNGVRIGFRLITSNKLIEICQLDGLNTPMRNIASFGQSRIISDREWSFVSREYVDTTYESETKQVNGEQVLMVTHRIFSEKGERLGALGRKLLMSSAIYQAPQQKIQKALTSLWKLFVENSRQNFPGLPPDEIIDSIIRSDKFSKIFRKQLYRRIESIKCK